MVALTVGAAPAGHDMGDVGHFTKWSRIEIAMSGPPSKATGQPNPFSLFVDVVFNSPSGKKWDVPGFYDGNVWKVRFAADETGRWTFRSRSRDRRLQGYSGSFEVTRVAPDAEGSYKWGRLESVSTAANKIRYLKFRDGPYWLKAGSDDPEGFLSPTLKDYKNNALRKRAIDYWADKGINCLYVMTHKINGDPPQDVYPWWGDTPSQAAANAGRDARFDVAKLERWRELFAYMNAKGVVPYLVLEDDGGGSRLRGKLDHGRYYREMIARFGHLPALVFNFKEEHNEGYSLPEALKHMRTLRAIDPYGHPRGIHNVNSVSNAYVDAEQVDLTSIQTGAFKPGDFNRRTIDWLNRCTQRKRRVLMVGFDEGRPADDRRSWWAVYVAGGVWESIWGKDHWATKDRLWTELGGTRAFMESVPFWKMQPHNELVTGAKAFCLAQPGVAYALYLPEGGRISVVLTGRHRYDYAWWDPANGKNGKFVSGGTVAGGRRAFTPPAARMKRKQRDWALRITVKTGGERGECLLWE